MDQPSADNLSTAEILTQLPTVRKQLIQLSLQAESALTEAQQIDVRNYLLWLNQISEYQTLGICADTLTSAESALKAYVAALSQPIRVDFSEANQACSGGVFLKFNTLKNAWYLDNYTGTTRGVLVTYHTSEPELDAVNGTYGPFPLSLFA